MNERGTANPEKIVKAAKTNSAFLVLLGPATVSVVFLAWFSAGFSKNADILYVAGVLILLSFAFAVFFRNKLLAEVGAEALAVVSEILAENMSGKEAEGVLTQVSGILEQCRQVDKEEKENMKLVLNDLSKTLSESSALAGLLKEKSESMICSLAPFTNFEGQGENQETEDLQQIREDVSNE